MPLAVAEVIMGILQVILCETCAIRIITYSDPSLL